MSEAPETASKLALCIGINDYPGAGSDLHGCVNDALDWSHELSARGFSVHRLLDAEATGAAIRGAIRSLVAAAKKGSLVVITFSAHGSFQVDQDGDEEDGMDECWCPHDVVAEGPITDDELNAMFTKRRKGVRLLVISDSCHSGTMSRLARSDEAMGSRREPTMAPAVRFLAPEVFNAGLRTRGRAGLMQQRFAASAPGRNSALLLSGCQDSEYSYDAWFDGRANGAFTHIALRALKSLPHAATYADWHEQIRQSLPSQHYPQSPNLYGDAAMTAWGVLKTATEEEGSPASSAPIAPPAALSTKRSADDDAFSSGVAMASAVLQEKEQSRRSAPEHQRTPRGRRPVIIAEGDSWFDFPWFARGPSGLQICVRDVLECLEEHHGYEVHECASSGDTLVSMATSPKQLSKLHRIIENVGAQAGRELRGILVSGGGNDIAGESFASMLNDAGSSQPGLNHSVVSTVIDVQLRTAYIRLLSSITEVSRRATNVAVPIFIHGYDYPVPDGRGYLGGSFIFPGPWLEPGFLLKGYRDLAENTLIVGQLIDRFNGMLKDIAGSPFFPHVRFVNLRGRLHDPTNYKAKWSDELHPTREGFRIIAQEFALALRATP